MSEDSNIDYWERILKAPTSSYQSFFSAEHDYLVKEIPHGARVLDVGCGEGRNMRSILEATLNVSGVDNDPDAVESAKVHFQNKRTVEVLKGEAIDLPFSDNTFDVVTFLMILPNLGKDKVKALQETCRVLKYDGFVILSSFAETALEERTKVYQSVQIPITNIEGGRLTLGNSVTSEQFSLDDLGRLAHEAGLKIIFHDKIGSLAYICKLVKF